MVLPVARLAVLVLMLSVPSQLATLNGLIIVILERWCGLAAESDGTSLLCRRGLILAALPDEIRPFYDTLKGKGYCLR